MNWALRLFRRVTEVDKCSCRDPNYLMVGESYEKFKERRMLQQDPHHFNRKKPPAPPPPPPIRLMNELHGQVCPDCRKPIQ